MSKSLAIICVGDLFQPRRPLTEGFPLFIGIAKAIVDLGDAAFAMVQHSADR